MPAQGRRSTPGAASINLQACGIRSDCGGGRLLAVHALYPVLQRSRERYFLITGANRFGARLGLWPFVASGLFVSSQSYESGVVFVSTT